MAVEVKYFKLRIGWQLKVWNGQLYQIRWFIHFIEVELYLLPYFGYWESLDEG